MKTLVLPLLTLVLTCPLTAASHTPSSPAQTGWVGLEVGASEESSAVGRLAEAGIPAIAWSTAVVEVSDFDPLAFQPLAHLGLTPDDPRWDPWLRGLTPWFRPSPDRSVVWVEAAQADHARTLVGGHQLQDPGDHRWGPRQVTGWVLLLLGVLYAVLRLVVTLGSPPEPAPRRWLWLAGTLVVLGLGTTLVVASPGAATSAHRTVSWLQHRWFQENWPYGAKWDDWRPSEAWTYPSVERQNGKLVPVTTTLTKADEAWSRAAWDSLPPLHAARIFGPENP